MTAVLSDNQMADSLRSLIARKEEERDLAIKRIRSLYQQQIDSLQQAVAQLNGAGHLSTDDQRPDLPSVSGDKIDAVRRVLREHGRIRQADIAPLLEINSGSVSAALRHLLVSEEVERGPKEQGSQVFVFKPKA